MDVLKLFIAKLDKFEMVEILRNCINKQYIIISELVAMKKKTLFYTQYFGIVF